MTLGSQAEMAAERWLETTKSYRPVSRNVRCPGGEVDLVMQDQDEWIFIEVKARTSNRFGTAAESITAKKLRSMQRVVAWYFRDRDQIPYYRLEAVLVENGRFTHMPDLF